MKNGRESLGEFLVSKWLPALRGVPAKLSIGARVADVGCGWGRATLLMAEAFPLSRFVGFDVHEPSIRLARQRADELGLADRVRFEVAAPHEFAGDDYDLITFVDARHGLGDPAAALRHAELTLAADGTVMIVEPALSRAEEILRAVAEGAGLRTWQVVWDSPATRVYDVKR